MTTLLLVAAVASVLGAGRASAARCEPITYTLQASPPAEAIGEFLLAIEEIHRRTGLVFEEVAPSTAKLQVTWPHHGVTVAASSSIVSGHPTTRAVAFGKGRWRRVRGGRVLVDALIEVDPARRWALGIDRGDGLAAVLVHELGHVIGLEHSPESTSFMHDVVAPRRPGWTADDLVQLERAGRRSGCSPPHATV